MPDLLEHMYCSQQINIPPNLPFILKQYAKAAIRTQPHDLLFWSAAYFKAKANNSPPPVKERLEYPPIDTPSRLSPGFLKVLHKQLGNNEFVAIETLYEKWLGVCLVEEALESMMKIGNIHGKIPWLKFVAIAAGHLCPSLTKTMTLVCEVLTEEPDGGSAMIPVETFVPLYQFLAQLDCGPNPPYTVPPVDAESGSMPGSQLSTNTINQCSPRELLHKDQDITEKDSTAGLMVWDDLKPQEKQDRVQTPKHTDEIGASSSCGLEVLDGAEGPVTEVITLFSVHEPIESEASIPAPSTLGSEVDESILSHTSLKENEDWIKIKPQKEDGEVVPVESSIKDTEISLETAESEKTVTGEDITIPSENEEVEDLALESVKSSKMSPKESKHDEPSEADIASKSGNASGDVSQVSTLKVIHNETKSETETEEPLLSDDSAVDLKESVTVQHFIEDEHEESIVSYSTAEIRKGVFGDKSGDKIERASSENTVKAAETVHKIGPISDESSEFIEQEKEVEEKLREDQSPTEKELSQQGSKSFIVLPQEENWQHIPGIGPVIPEPQILAVVEYMQYWAAKQHGMVMPRNINHILCPPLDLQPASEDEDDTSHY